MKMKWSIEKKTLLGFGLVLTLFAGSIAVAFQSTTNLIESNRLVSHTQDVLRAIDGIVSTITEAETGQRGYIITGDETYLQPYNQALSKIGQRTSQARELVVDNPDQERRLASLDSLLSTRLDTISSTILAYKQDGFEASQRIINSGRGKEEMDAIRGIAAEMVSEENSLLAQRSAEARESMRRAGYTFFFLVILIVAMLVFVYYLVRRDSAERRRSELEIKTLNAELEHRVSERTTQLQTANQELEVEMAERKRSQAVLAASEERFNAFMNHSPAAAWLKDDKGCFVYANKAFEQANNVTLADLRDKTSFELWPREVAERIQQEDRAVLSTGETVETIEDNRTLDGSLKHLLIFKFPVRDASGQLFVGGVAIDITERKQAEEALQQAMAELAHSNAELQQFAYVASHDLQEPLRMVASYTQLLAKRYKDKLDDDAQEFITYAVDGANRMQRLINDLLSYSRLTTKRKPVGPVDCEVVLSNTLANLRVAIEENDVTITHDPLPTAMGDDIQLVQLFQNLIGNAIKFRGPEPQRIHIGVESGEHDWLFCVRDNGIGMEPQYFERIFAIFQRLHAKAEYPGTGIGLAVCKKVVERHGGRIWVESQLGKGSTFYFTLPRDPQSKLQGETRNPKENQLLIENVV